MRGWTLLQDIQEAKAFCPAGHPYTDENTYRYRGARRCKECKRQRQRARYKRGQL